MQITENALKRIINKYGQDRRYKYKMMNDPIYFGELYTTMLHADGKFNPELGFKKSTYVIKAIKNKMKTICKKLSKQHWNLEDIEMDTIDFKNWCKAHKKEKLMGEVFDIIGALPFREKYVIVERFLEDKTLKEIAEDMAYSIQQIAIIEKSAIERIREKYGRAFC